MLRRAFAVSANLKGEEPCRPHLVRRASRRLAQRLWERRSQSDLSPFSGEMTIGVSFQREPGDVAVSKISDFSRSNSDCLRLISPLIVALGRGCARTNISTSCALPDWREGRRMGSRKTPESRAILDLHIPATALSGRPRRLGGKRMRSKQLGSWNRVKAQTLRELSGWGRERS